MSSPPLWAPWRVEYVVAQKPAGCVFCAAWEGEGEELLLHRGAEAGIILNAFPYAPGHLMVFPRRHLAAPEDLQPGESAALWQLLVASLQALRQGLAPHGFNVGLNLGRVAGAGLPGHLHLHVVPRWEGDTNFMPVVAETKVISEALSQTAAKLRPYLEGL